MTATVISRGDIDIATRAAENFTRLYYTAYDSDTRLADLPAFYRSHSSLTWNGRPIQGVDELKQFIEKMPPTKHEMLSFDCHPIPDTSPPSILITTSGNITHGRPHRNQGSANTKNVDTQARVFSQTFMLVPDPDDQTAKAGELAKYYISADTLRFVG